MSRVYIVTDSTTDARTLVEADSQHQAVGIVVASRYTAAPASAKEVLDAIGAGATVLKKEVKALPMAAPVVTAPTPVVPAQEPTVDDPLSQDHPADGHAI